MGGVQIKGLYIGDIHAVPAELGDCWSLVHFIVDVAKKEQVDFLVFLGDQSHTHSIIRVEVMAFWLEAFRMLKGLGVPVLAMVGNHDRPGDPESELHSMLPYEDLVTVVSKPYEFNNILFIPFLDTAEDVEKTLQSSPLKVAVCHQTFDGATYENGVRARDGVSLKNIHQSLIITGHIHKPQEIKGKVHVWCMGAPRWRTKSDANIARAIWVVEHTPDGLVVGRKAFDTSKVCRAIRSIEDTPEAPIGLPLDSGVDWRVDIKGPGDWCDSRKKLIAGPGIRVRIFKSTERLSKVRESDGVDKAFCKYLEAYRPRYGTPKVTLRELAEKRVHVREIAR